MRDFFWDDYGPKLPALLVGLTLVVGVILGIALWLDGRDEKSCAAKGGHRVQTGTSTTYILSGKVMVPVTTAVYSCDVPA